MIDRAIPGGLPVPEPLFFFIPWGMMPPVYLYM